MYCGNSSSESPRQNRLLLDLLWEQYTVKYGIESLPTTNIMPRTLSNDIECRITHIKSLIQTLKGKMAKTTSVSELNKPEIECVDTLIENSKKIENEIEHANSLVAKLEKIKEKTDQIPSTAINDIDGNKLNDYLKEYVNQLTGDRCGNRKCEHFICICEQLLYYNQEAEFKRYFPALNKKMNEWEHSFRTEEKFQPKIIEGFKACQNDLGRYIIPSIPCRVGVIGRTSAGKSSLSNGLRGVKKNYNEKIKAKDDENSQKETTRDEIMASPMRVRKSTYCRLEFEHQYDNGRKIIFVDIEGSTDTDLNSKLANYFDEIRKADCDLYIIVFDHQFTDIQHEWHDYIVNQLHRECWLVRSKVDELFLNLFKEEVGQDFDSSDEVTKNKCGETIIEQIRDTVSLDIHGKKLSNVYLTFTSYDENSRNENLSKMSYSIFDLGKLINDINNLPISLYENRLQKMAVCAIAKVINNCFRRGYVVNVMKYKIAAGITAVIPFLDLIPRYYGREEIRQAFGVNTRSRFMNWLTGETDKFKDYLKEFDIAINESRFGTSAFSKTFRKNAAITQQTAKGLTSFTIKGATTLGVAGVSVSDDVMRAVGVGAINAVRGVSTSFIVVGAVLTVGMCAWAAVSNGKQMYDYLHRLCDDLIIISDHVTMKIIKDNNETRNSFSEPE
ncbi:unnamed protein product [Didymodactylos carnosus]|uniref:G domain-containing protein n=1 Tax=Didymodactylos carnosus TaxID=1234261 RepID=A0A814SM29_9BILA|nr:unnamed protein product [Didymodactylos carnosus]CAF1175140.1 unnamed protein product [Didymodactylos carnosus]CAF3913621.1 unnamed protein product [Didymodactylos carnosus]CAF3986371.1 unnamed protein product [Didymodactylos carnosus]